MGAAFRPGLAYDALMRGSLIGFAGLLLLFGARVIQAAPADYLSLSAGGLMTAGLHIYIDLASGFATMRTTPHGSWRPGEHPVWRETKKRLSPDELRRLKEVIRSSLREGLTSKACYGQRPHPPLADSILSLDVLLNGQSGHAPARDCESPAFTKLWAAAVSAASTH